jgi:flagellar basal-body rod protein FlgG
MINGMYLSTMGAMVQNARHGVTANNLANSNTTGFKPDYTRFRAIPAESVLQPGHRREIDEILEQTGGGTWLDETATDFTPGAFRHTGNPFDLAIDDAQAADGRVGFFMVRPGGEAGEVLYTRDGSFRLNGSGQLVTSTGALVLDPQGGPIQIPDGAGGVRVNADGWIRSETDNTPLAQIGVVRTAEPLEMTKVGDNLFRRDDAELANDQSGVRHSTLESSAANPIFEMVNMIEGFRSYEANMRFITIQDQTLGDTVSRVGRVA